MAMFVSDRRWPQLGWPARGPWSHHILQDAAYAKLGQWSRTQLLLVSMVTRIAGYHDYWPYAMCIRLIIDKFRKADD